MFDQNGQNKSITIVKGQTIDFPDNQKLTYRGFHQYTVLNIKHDPGTTVVLIGMTLMALCSPLFWLGKYQKIKLNINHSNKSMSVTVVCKNKGLKEKVKDSILQRMRG